MNSKLKWFFKNAHLITSLIIVVPTAIIYGSSIISKHLNIKPNTIDLLNLLKAIMFLYLAIASIWFLALLKTKYWKSATVLNIVFMLSLALGRILSILIDGLPSNGYIFAIIIELIIGVFSIYQLKKYSLITSW